MKLTHAIVLTFFWIAFFVFLSYAANPVLNAIIRPFQR